ncbi:MAG: FHA domain-containing protein [Elusimicrobia bacterium]|nr:FHA domain-containing protein [Elusimicrobiota bacterium]
MPKFLLKFNAAIIKEIPVNKDSMTVGRKDDNDIIIDNPAVSGHHCKIYLQSDVFFVEDLNSTNGTYVNEKKILKAGLKNNDAIGIVKHALVFIDDRPSAGSAQAANPEATVALSQTSQAQMAQAAAASAKTETTGILSVVNGVVDKPEYELNGLSTYIGKSEKVQIPVKGGMFTPEVAAMIARRPEGYFLIALKPGYPKLNGANVQERELLHEGDMIEISGTTFRFDLKKP